MTTALSFENVSKNYRGAHEYRALRDDVVGAVRRLTRVERRTRNVVQALDDVSFDVPEGQAFGLIGPNGAGKTTSLKLATRISYPTLGRVRVRGRVSALIEVGTGMHPELTGRENIRLYGRILGLSRRDIAKRFDDVVEFAGIGAAIDQPVKQFSSGMQLRLGFSIAAHLEPDVLLVDEAIAVGDAGFQYQCIERMAQLVREGRTLVLVSHYMSAIETLCERAILLRNGKIAADGPAREVVGEYLLAVQADQLANTSAEEIRGSGPLKIVRVSLHDASHNEVDEVATGQPMTVRLHYHAQEPIPSPIFSVGLSDGRVGCFTLASMLVDGATPDVISGMGHIDCAFDDLPLRPRAYELWGSVRGEAGWGEMIDWQRLRIFRVTGEVVGTGKGSVTHSMDDAPVVIPYSWKFNNGVE